MKLYRLTHNCVASYDNNNSNLYVCVCVISATSAVYTCEDISTILVSVIINTTTTTIIIITITTTPGARYGAFSLPTVSCCSFAEVATKSFIVANVLRCVYNLTLTISFKLFWDFTRTLLEIQLTRKPYLGWPRPDLLRRKKVLTFSRERIKAKYVRNVENYVPVILRITGGKSAYIANVPTKSTTWAPSQNEIANGI